MKQFDITAQFLSKCLKNSAFHGLFLMFFVGCLSAQPMAHHRRMGVPKEAVIQSKVLNCADLVLTIQPINNGLGCCYRLLANNSNPDNCFGNISLTLNVGEFSNFTILSGWQFNTGGPAEYTVRPAIGFIPFGPSSIAEFCVESDSDPTLTLFYDDLCLMEGCATEFLVNGCFDPANASIVGVKYRECGSLPYTNQTPLSGWTIELLDANGNVIGERVTEVDGSYVFFDLKAGSYVVREVQQPGWTARVPASGQTAIDLAASQERIVNFGNCPPAPPPCDCPAGTQPGGNAVVNSDFSGSGGFTSAYTLNNNNPPLQSGEYWIGSNPAQINPGFAACGDHTSGAGNMMVVNGAGSQNNTIWSQTFNVTPNTTYQFQAWVASLSSASPAQVGVILTVGNNQFGGFQIFAPVTTCSWARLCNEWYNFNATSVTISLINQNVAATGNDFALDDISFQKCVPPNGVITGVIYQECEARAYLDQPVLSGWTVQLLDTMNNLIEEVVTDNNGAYAFADRPLGYYWVRTALQPGWTSNVPATGQTTVELDAGESEVANFGVCPLPGTISGVLYSDCDSMLYTNQPILSNWTVQLLDTLGNLIAEQLTDSSGRYAFNDLPKGKYIIKEIAAPGWTPNIPASGQYTVELIAGGSVVANFGVCRGPVLACICPAAGVNLVMNPDFSSLGGFGSDYTPSNGNPPLQNGEYWVGSNPNLINSNFQACDDHGVGSGNMLMINGKPPTQYAVNAIWSQTINVVQHQNYQFSVWVSPLVTGGFITGLGLEADGQSVGGNYPSGIACKWQKFCGIWNSGNKTQVKLELTGHWPYGPIAIDDISFRQCGTSGPPRLYGVVYSSCDSMPYTDQPLLSGWTVQVQDTMGNLIDEQVTDSSGTYAFYDLPMGLYYINTVAQSGWTPNIPASGKYSVEIVPDGSVVANFGVCNVNCQCNTIQTTVLPTSSGPNACCYSLSIMSANQCYTYINIQVDAGTSILPSFVQTGWTATQINPQWIQLTLSNGGLVPIGTSSPLTFCVSGNSVHSVLVTHGFTDSGGTYECDNNYTFSCSNCGGGCPPPNGLAVSDLDLTSATLSWIPSVCAESTWIYLIDEQDNSEHISRPIPVSSLLLDSLTPGGLYRVVAFSMCGTEMSGPSDTIFFSTPCSDCPDNLLSNGGFEIPLFPSMSTPNAPGQIFYSANWSSTSVSFVNQSDWFSFGSPFNNFPGTWYNTSTQLYYILGARCGKKYAGFDFNLCEGIKSYLSAPIVFGDGYEIDLWWSVKEPVTQNFEFKPGLTGSGNCTSSSINALCTNTCGSYGPTIYVTTNHKPGIWYHSSFSGNYSNPLGPTLDQLIITPSTFSSANNYIYIDDVCVRKRIIPCNTGSPRITQSPDQPFAFLGEADLGVGSTLVSAVWDFGDGTKDSSCCLGSVIHDFAPGSYEVCLTVTAMDTSGATCSNSTCIPVDITTQSTKCDKVAAFLSYYDYSPNGDCCYRLGLANTEPNCFTQVDVTLSSGNFANTQFQGWNVAINGNTASLTYPQETFLPLWPLDPIFICDLQGSDPYTVDVDFVYAGGVCHREFDFSCEGNCSCLGFSNLQFTAHDASGPLPNPPPPVPVDCENGTPVTLQCNPFEHYFFSLEGNFGCTSECPSSVHYELFDKNHNLIGQGQGIYNSGLDQFMIGLPDQPGTYQLVLTGFCGTETCSCTVNFIISPCGCCSDDFDDFIQNVDLGVNLVSVPNTCKATLDLSALLFCQQIAGTINWGDQTTSQGPFITGDMPMHVYSQSGTYTITYTVIESNPASGGNCFQKTFTETINVTCEPCNCQESNLALVQNGVSHPVLCGNPSQTPTFGCPVSDVTLTGSIGCVQPDGSTCTQSSISWNLYGPNGFVSKGTLPGPALGITFPAVDISVAGTYTVSLQTLCPGQSDSCYCTLQWIQEDCSDPCCTGTYAAFLSDALNVQTNGTLGTCSLGFEATGLTGCMQISYLWGDGTTSAPVLANNIPVSHTYSQGGTYNVCHTIEEVNASGVTCHAYTACQEVNVLCDNCMCGNFSEMYARPTAGAQSIALTCGGPSVAFGCPQPGFSIPITGKFECQSGNCDATSVINWTLTGPGPNGSYSGTIQAGPYFYLPILPYQYGTPGNYTLTLVGNCGGQPCTPCVIKFSVNCADPCPCSLTQLVTDISKGFANILYNNSCTGCFSPIALNDCDMVQWSVNGGSVEAVTNGNGTFCYLFPGAGTYLVSMTVIRKKADGSTCAQASVTRSVTLTCASWPDCGSLIIANPRMSEGPMPGGLNSGGASTGWIGLTGNPVVVEGAAGSLDGWTIDIGGKLDSSDVLSQLEPICLTKDTGMLSFRITRPPNASHISFGCNLSVQLFRGNVFVLEYPTWNPIRCLKLASIELAPLDTGWVDVQVPYDVSTWNVVDTCGDEPYGVYVRPVIYVNNALSSDQGGASTRSSVQIDNFCLDGTLVGVKNPLQKGIFRIFPNPNAGTFSVEFPEAATSGMRFKIMGLTGQVVQEQSIQTGNTIQTIQAGDLPAGLYFLQVVKDGQVLAVEKFVKQ